MLSEKEQMVIPKERVNKFVDDGELVPREKPSDDPSVVKLFEPGRGWLSDLQVYEPAQEKHWSETVKPRPDHEFVNVRGRWVELHIDLIYGVTPYQLLQRKWKAWKENLKILLIQFLIKLLSISGRQCINFCRTVLVSPFTFIKKVLYYPFTVIPTKSVLENYIKNSRNSKKYGTRNRA